METSLEKFIKKNNNTFNIKSIYLYNIYYNYTNEDDNKYLYEDIKEHYKIYSFPIEICYLINLEILSICNIKEIIYIPNEINNLINLKELYLNNNNITIIPNEVYTLNKLKILNLSYNNITNISIYIKNLILLEYLYLNNNNINNVPKEIYTLNKLKILKLSYNIN